MNSSQEKHDTQHPASRAGQALILMSGLVSATIVTVALSELQGIFRPFLIAAFLCFLVKPLTKKLNRRAGIFGYAFAFAILFGVFFVAQSVITHDIADFDTNKAGYKDKDGHEIYAGYQKHLDGYKAQLRKASPKVFEDFEPKFFAWMDDVLNPKTISRILGTGASFFFGVFGEILIVLIVMMLLLIESDRLPARLRRVYGVERAARIEEVFREVGRSVTRYVSLKVWVNLLTAVICIIIMSLFNLHYAITFGIIVFAFNFIPYLGSVVATLFPCIIALVQWETPWNALWIGITLTVAQLVVGNFIEPRIQGKGLSISPVVIVLSLGFWGWLWGIGGMILAVPITVTIRIFLEQFETTRQLAMMMGGDD